MGMGFSDFCSCTPSEFREVYEAWKLHDEYSVRSSWEQTRVLCTAMLQPYSKKKLRVRDVFPLPWDRKGQQEADALSEAERKAQYEAAKKRYGIE